MTVWRDMLVDLRVNPGRSALTAVSLFLGVFAVMSIIVVGNIVNEVFTATAEQQGGRYQTFERVVPLPASLSPSDVETLLGALPADGASVAGQLGTAQPLIVATAPQSDPATQQRVCLSVTTILVTGSYTDIYRLPMTSGRWLDPAYTSPYEMVVNKSSASTLGGPGTLVWLTSATTATAFPVEIVGVVNDGNAQARAYLEASQWLHNAPHILSSLTLTMLWNQPGGTSDQIQSMSNDWLADHGLPTDSTTMETDSVASYRQFILVMQWSFTGIALLSLIVAAIGIVNIGLASITQRTHELVIRRAIGASKTTIAAMIIGSSLLLSVIVAGISAVTVGIGISIFTSTLPPDSAIQPPPYPVVAALTGIAVSISTALLGSIIPGWKAARLQPGLALRV